MILVITLIFIFFTSAFILFRRISEKLPAIIAIPEEAVREHLLKDRDRSRLYLFLVHFRTLWRERYFSRACFAFITKVLQKLHIFLLRLDNGVVYIARKIKPNGNGSFYTNGEYWKMLHGETGEHASEEKKEEVTPPDAQKKSLLSQLHEEKPVITVFPEHMTAEQSIRKEPQSETVFAKMAFHVLSETATAQSKNLSPGSSRSQMSGMEKKQRARLVLERKKPRRSKKPAIKQSLRRNRQKKRKQKNEIAQM